MTITSMDGLVAGIIGYPTDLYKDAVTAEAAGVWHSGWYQTGNPGVSAAPSSGLAGSAHAGTVAAGVAGQIPIPAALGGSTRIYLTRLSAAHTGNVGMLRIYDRLWTNSGITITTTTGQTVNSVAFPARDQSASTSGAGVYVGIEVSSATGNGGAITNTTMTYTNSAGVGSKTATIASFPASAVVGTFIPFSLSAGDLGVRSIQTLTLGTSYVSGTIHLVAYRLIAELPMPAANTGFSANFTSLNMPTIWDSSVLWPLWLPTATALGTVSGSLSYAQG